MHRSSLVTAAALLLCGTVAAQQSPQTLKPLKIPAGTQIKNAGTYHLATGTWTRGTAGTAALGNDVVYTNDANTGYFTGLSTGDSIIDEGEIPASNIDPGNQNRDRYVINGFTTAYCTANVRSDIVFRYGWYNCYSPCGDPATLGLGGKEIEISLAGVLPGSNATGAFSCWLVTLDLVNTTAEFKMRASCNGTHDSSTATDSFGWSMEVDYPSNPIPTGPFINGDPNYYAFGDGTYYKNPGGPPPVSNTGTGYGTQDFFFGTGPGFNTSFTCYFFGGYKNTIGPNAASVPYGSFWMSMYSDENDVHNCLRYCGGQTVPSNNTGLKSRMMLETQDSTGGLVSCCERSLADNAAPNRMVAIVKDAPGLGNGGVTNIGYFIMGTGQNTFVPPGSLGPICVAPGLKRFLTPASMTSETVVCHDCFNGNPTTTVGEGFSKVVYGNGATDPASAFILPGTRWNFQAWHRDTPGDSNLSDAISVDFTP